MQWEGIVSLAAIFSLVTQREAKLKTAARETREGRAKLITKKKKQKKQGSTNETTHID